MDTLVLADLQRLHQFRMDTGCYLNDLPRAMADRMNYKRESRESTPSAYVNEDAKDSSHFVE